MKAVRNMDRPSYKNHNGMLCKTAMLALDHHPMTELWWGSAFFEAWWVAGDFNLGGWHR